MFPYDRESAGGRAHIIAAAAKLEPQRLGLTLPMLDELGELGIPLGTARV